MSLTTMPPFPEFNEQHGPPFDCRRPTQADLDAYQNRLPDPLIDVWRQSGWCAYADGLIWLVNPDDFVDLLENWQKSPDTAIVFGRTAFADLILWDNNEVQYIDVQHGLVASLTKDIDVFFYSFLCDDDHLDNVVKRKLFREALPRLGRPRHDECYAFEPVLALGGPGTADTLARVNLFVHLSILAQIVLE